MSGDSTRRWFLVCRQYGAYPLDEAKRELGDEFELQRRHLEPDIENEKYLVDLGRLADHHIHQIVKQELVRIVFKLAGLYHQGHPTGKGRYYVPLKAAAVTDMEQNAYMFYFVPENHLLDFWLWDPLDDPEQTNIEDRRERAQRLAFWTDPMGLLNTDGLTVRTNAFYAALANAIRRADQVDDDSPVLKAVADVALEAAAICREADIPFDDELESEDWTFARLVYTREFPAGQVVTESPRLEGGPVAKVEWACDYDRMLRRIQDGYENYADFHTEVEDHRLLVATVLKSLLTDESDRNEAIELIRAILDGGKANPPTGRDTGIDRGTLNRIEKVKYPMIFGNYRSEGHGDMHNGYFLRPPYDVMLPRVIDLLDEASRDEELLASITENAESVFRQNSLYRLFRYAYLFLAEQ